MGNKLKTEELSAAARAQLLLVTGALDMTKIKGALRRACLLVLVHGKTQAEAARQVKRKRQNVYRAIRKLEPKLAEVKSYVESL